MREAEPRAGARWRALAGLALSGAGELLTRAAGSPGWGALLLAAGGSCLALDAFRAPERPREEEPDRPARRGIRPAVLMSLGAALACALAILRLFERDFESRGAIALWALALALVIGGGLLAGTWLRIPRAGPRTPSAAGRACGAFSGPHFSSSSPWAVRRG